ncbi:MAG: 16S rRNA (cytosine(1402)-N(4))-methyltransferase RsmH [Opitutales bacterium]
MTAGGHEPVLLGPITEALTGAAPANPLYLDATFGGGGHTRALLDADPAARVIALDRDPAAATRADDLARTAKGRIAFRRANFADLDACVPETGLRGILFDLGVSSFQLDTVERGFAFRHDAPADMRMDPDQGLSAADFLETADRADLIRAIRDYGEERQWRKVVEAIIRARGTGALQRTASLAELIAGTVGPVQRGRSRVHPATRAFQGIRIAVNDELGALPPALEAAFDRLAPGGVLAVISFHSLEDRIVKQRFREWAGRPVSARDHRSQMERTVQGEELSRRPLQPDETEAARNPRSRSARLRMIRKLPA